MWYDLDCTNVRKLFIGGDFIPKKETRLGFTNPNFVDRLNQGGDIQEFEVNDHFIEDQKLRLYY